MTDTPTVADGTETTDIESLIGYNLKRAYIVVQTDFKAALGEDGLSARVFSALSFVVNKPNITQSELARRLGIERSGLVAIVDELEELGYLKRAPVPGDRRVQALVPTPAGETAFAAAMRTVAEHENQLFRDITSSERAQLLALLGKIRKATPRG
jgi:DNA-binding MarR family transcriptional regulator